MNFGVVVVVVVVVVVLSIHELAQRSDDMFLARGSPVQSNRLPDTFTGLQEVAVAYLP
jgi:hypothetical protein